MSAVRGASKAVRIAASVMLLALLLAGCTTGPRPVPDDREAAWTELQARLQGLTTWQAEGRLSVRSRGDAGNANFTWIEQSDGGFRLRLGGPLGQGGGRLSGGDSARAVLVTADGQRYAGEDAAGLLRDLYGWEIPVSGLRHWLLGLPGDEAEYRLDRFGRLASLNWRGWHIEYRRYRNVGELDLPVTLVAGNKNDGTEIRIAIDHWDVGARETDPESESESPVPLMGG